MHFKRDLELDFNIIWSTLRLIAKQYSKYSLY